MAGLLGGKKPKPVPLPDEAKIESARIRAIQEAQASSGRKSTQLTQPQAQTGQEFARKTLG